MHLNEYQELSQATAIYPRQFPFQALAYVALGLGGEAGEFQNKAKRLIRGNVATSQSNSIEQQIAREDMAEELGDTLWYLAACAHELGYTLQTIATANLVKLQSREERDVIQGEGDHR